MEKFLISAVVMLVAVTVITFILMRVLFKNSVFRQIGFIWVLTMVFNSINTNARITFDAYPQAIALPAGIIVIALGIFLASRHISPLNVMIQTLQDLARGNLKVKKQKKYLNRKNEIGYLAESIDSLADTFNELLSEVKTSSSQLVAVSVDLADITQRMTESSGNQTIVLNDILDKIQNISASVIKNAEKSVQTQKAIKHSELSVKMGTQTSKNSIAAMQDVIKKIQVVNDIAWKTNLLSLNAAIEASRAGAAGKGFGVVATEIKKLSQKSNEAADNIAKVSEKVMFMTEKAGTQIKKNTTETQKSSKLVKLITDTTIKQSTNAEKIDGSVNTLNSLLKENMTISGDISLMSKDIKQNAKKLNEIIEGFEKNV